MKTSWFSRLSFPFLVTALFTVPIVAAQTQGASPQGANARAAPSQLSAAFSGGKVVQQVQLSGDAKWYAGSTQDSGTANLIASADGSSQMQLALGALGQKTETQTGSGSSAICQWAGADGVAHAISADNCWKPVLWFLPALSLQPSLLPSNLGIVDLGTSTVGSSTNVYRHLQSQLVFSGLPDMMTNDIMKQSTTDLGLDPETLLPAVLAYSVRPDNGAPVTITIEVHYSDYRVVNGVQIPFLIQRYVNGSLQLEVSISSAEIN